MVTEGDARLQPIPARREKKVGLEPWERVLTGILTNTSSANVLIFTQAPAIKASK